MADAKHTPGPWSYAPAVPGANRSFYIAGNNAEHNRQVDIGTVQGGFNSCEANARLIAAAPDLLEALQGLVNDDDAGVSLAEQRERQPARMAAAKAAIAKALERARS